MARQPRFIVPGQPQHVIQRGNNRQHIFLTEDDYIFFLDKLLCSAKEHQCAIHAYVLMTNHIHLLLTPSKDDSISKMMQMIGRYYVQYFNYKYQRTGTLWEGRYKATLINSEEYLFTCMKYIELNPVRAKMVISPSDYRWSSYQYNSLGEPTLIIEPHQDYLRLGKTSCEQQIAYTLLFEKELPQKTLDSIRYASNNNWVLGNEQFVDAIQHHISRHAKPRPRGGDRKLIQCQK